VLPIASSNSSPPISATHTRAAAYARAATEFFNWLAAKGVTQLDDIESVHVATYIEELSRARSAPTAKQRLAALRRLLRVPLR
jgi:site-specific recombinase XerD